MTTFIKTGIKAGVAAFAVFFAAMTSVIAATPEIYLNKRWDYAVDGYDVTSYFDGEPIKGDPQYSMQVANGTFIFASQDNLDTFLADPDAYRPAYGGHCAYALGKREILVKGDPQVWHIEGGVLYLNLNRGVQKKWLKDMDTYISHADSLWPSVLSR